MLVQPKTIGVNCVLVIYLIFAEYVHDYSHGLAHHQDAMCVYHVFWNVHIFAKVIPYRPAFMQFTQKYVSIAFNMFEYVFDQCYDAHPAYE